MFRITATEHPGRTIIIIDGELVGEHSATVENACWDAGSAGKPVELYLRDITSVDQCGELLLLRLADAGVSLSASGLYTSYLVNEISSRNGKTRIR